MARDLLRLRWFCQLWSLVWWKYSECNYCLVDLAFNLTNLHSPKLYIKAMICSIGITEIGCILDRVLMGFEPFKWLELVWASFFLISLFALVRVVLIAPCILIKCTAATSVVVRSDGIGWGWWCSTPTVIVVITTIGVGGVAIALAISTRTSDIGATGGTGWGGTGWGGTGGGWTSWGHL